MNQMLKGLIRLAIKHFKIANRMLQDEIDHLQKEGTHECKRSVTLRYVNLLAIKKRNFNPNPKRQMDPEVHTLREELLVIMEGHGGLWLWIENSGVGTDQ
jgi:hypothetical protein